MSYTESNNNGIQLKLHFQTSDHFAKYPNFFTTRFTQACSSAQDKLSLFTTSAYKSQAHRQIVIIETGDQELKAEGLRSAKGTPSITCRLSVGDAEVGNEFGHYQ